MKQLGPNIKKYPGYLLCTTYLEFLPALNYPPLPKKKMSGSLKYSLPLYSYIP